MCTYFTVYRSDTFAAFQGVVFIPPWNILIYHWLCFRKSLSHCAPCRYLFRSRESPSFPLCNSLMHLSYSWQTLLIPLWTSLKYCYCSWYVFCQFTSLSQHQRSRYFGLIHFYILIDLLCPIAAVCAPLCSAPVWCLHDVPGSRGVLHHHASVGCTCHVSSSWMWHFTTV